MSRHTILIVDDEPLIRFMLADAFDAEGYLVLEAATVLEAIGLLGKYPEIGALVTDVDMPGGLSGLDLVKLVERSCRPMAIVMVSGGHAASEFELPPHARFMPKPYDLRAVVDEINMQLESALHERHDNLSSAISR